MREAERTQQRRRSRGLRFSPRVQGGASGKGSRDVLEGLVGAGQPSFALERLQRDSREQCAGSRATSPRARGGLRDSTAAGQNTSLSWVPIWKMVADALMKTMDTGVIRAAVAAGVALFQAIPRSKNGMAKGTKGGVKGVLLTAFGAGRIGRAAARGSASSSVAVGSDCTALFLTGFALGFLVAGALVYAAVGVKEELRHLRRLRAPLIQDQDPPLPSAPPLAQEPDDISTTLKDRDSDAVAAGFRDGHSHTAPSWSRQWRLRKGHLCQGREHAVSNGVRSAESSTAVCRIC